MPNNTEKQKAILKELASYNKTAKKILKKRSFNYKVGYERLQKTETWINAKVLLIEYFSLSNTVFTCPVCESDLNPYASTMHHNIYDNRKLFDPKYINFLHYDCHQDYHDQMLDLATSTKKHLRVFLTYGGIKIYFAKKTKLFIPYGFCVLLIVIIVILIFIW